MTQKDLATKQKQTHGQREQTCGYQRGKMGGINWEDGINIHILTCIK